MNSSGSSATPSRDNNSYTTIFRTFDTPVNIDPLSRRSCIQAGSTITATA
jgi:hypothetical protein